MSEVTIRYGTTNTTDYYSPGEWNGKNVLVHELLYDEQGACLGHDLEPMTHHGAVHGELWCPHCCGVAYIPAANGENTT